MGREGPFKAFWQGLGTLSQGQAKRRFKAISRPKVSLNIRFFFLAICSKIAIIDFVPSITQTSRTPPAHKRRNTMQKNSQPMTTDTKQQGQTLEWASPWPLRTHFTGSTFVKCCQFCEGIEGPFDSFGLCLKCHGECITGQNGRVTFGKPVDSKGERCEFWPVAMDHGYRKTKNGEGVFLHPIMFGPPCSGASICVVCVLDWCGKDAPASPSVHTIVDSLNSLSEATHE